MMSEVLTLCTDLQEVIGNRRKVLFRELIWTRVTVDLFPE